MSDIDNENNCGTPAVAPSPIQQELAAGLLADKATTSPKYFYDAVGSVLFEAICVLPEYYPTRTEASIISEYLSDIAHAIGPGGTLIDLGAGNCAKAARLFPQLHPDQYVPIDISVDHLREAVGRLQQRFPHIEMTALGIDFSQDWSLPSEVRNERRLFFYPGSSIGNFEPEMALAFLKQLRVLCGNGGGILIGIDLIKEHAVLNAAYDDDLGVTAAFNLNVLRHINQQLGTDFDVHQWQHRAFFNADKSRIEMHLEARSEMTIRWPGEHRHFIRGERIHTENSYKYSLDSFLALLNAAGFGQSRHWTDDAGWFAVVYAKAI
ncbi:L-histidine N(alpha)-methyltransferase [Undibacterium sp. Jales W-56]|uniref:L-histidine N(alpha)-methyltransferase n=1 Tax=Undibacterium sp. Jales W-56 TaxID=2897325 RepID=UPI0021D36E51|nr:L-histidine N(alpha)-methyltransferase [Undibacterium sp. Jales W-56]MCU6434850.1 L-histidine N(alpha)-methyltransferase [Undibacterium sp. Jales W-56]